MYVTSIHVERFGASSHVRLDGLVSGLNVVFGPTGSGKTTMVHFLRAIFGGFGAGVREQYLIPASTGCGGTVMLQTAKGRQTISRYDDGGREGRLTLQRSDGPVLERHHLRDLFGDLHPSLLASAFFVDFHRRPELSELLDEAAMAGFALSEEGRASQHQAVAREIADGQQHAQSLQQEIQTIERSLAELGRRRQQLESQLADSTPHSANLETSNLELREVELQLGRWKRTLRDIVQHHRRAVEHRDQLGRCEIELRGVIRLLVARRRKLLVQSSHAQAGNDLHSEGDEMCQDHSPTPQKLNEPQGERMVAKTAAQELEDVCREITRLGDVRLKWLAEVDEWETDLADRRAELARLNEMTHFLISGAAEYLHRLTSGEWAQIQISANREVSLENQAGEHVRYENLDAGVQDQLYLAFCLAIVAGSERRGRRLPLVLNAAFTYYPSQSIRRAVEVLREFGHGQQVICFTRHEHVVSVARLLNVPVQYAAQAVQSGELQAMLTPSPTPAVAKRTAEIKKKSATVVPTVKPVCTSHQRDASDQEFCLHQHDPIERTPFLDTVNADRLRKIGLSRVGDLLRIPVSELALELREAGVTLEIIKSWRAQARLLCGARGLRPYDARILVACGIRDPEQLIQMRPGALRARVKEFASSVEGHAILMSGTEYELSRVTDWIRPTPNDCGRRVAHSSVANAAPELPRSRARRARQPRQTGAVTGTKATQDIQGGGELAASDTPTADRSPPHIVPLSGPEHETPYQRQETDAVADLPWIPAAVVHRLRKLKVITVADLLQAKADVLSTKLGTRRVTSAVVQQWQTQTELVCRIPHLRCADVQLLAVFGITNLEQLASTPPAELWRKLAACCESPDGKRLLGTSPPPGRADIAGWIVSACQPCSGHAA